MEFCDLVKVVPSHLQGSGDIPKLTLEERLDILGIDKARKDQIKELQYIEVNFDESEYEKNNYKDSILIKDLIGVNRGRLNNDNWLNTLSNLDHDQPFLYLKEGNSFDDFIKMVMELLPDEKIRVLKDSNGKYVINNDGMHRLTIAKCLGIKQISVTVTELKEQISFVNS